MHTDLYKNKCIPTCIPTCIQHKNKIYETENPYNTQVCYDMIMMILGVTFLCKIIWNLKIVYLNIHFVFCK